MQDHPQRSSSSFTFLNLTQFLGTLNDNLFKFLLTFFCIGLQGAEASPRILASAGALFVLPFLLLSSYSGILADRFSKRNVIVLCKGLEVIVMALGTLAFAWESSAFAFFVLFLMATQSALFSPSKFGIVPEIVQQENLSRANGYLACFSYMAIVFGTFLASFATQITNRNYLMGGFICLSIALLGFITSLFISYTTPAARSTAREQSLFLQLKKSLQIIRQQPGLLVAVLGSGYVFFLGAFVQLNIVPYAMQILGLSDVQGGYLFLLTSIGIGAGSMLAGRLSGKCVELGLVPIGGIGMTIGCLLLDTCSNHLALFILLIISIGLFGGIFVVPLDSFIQHASPQKFRGQVVAASNFIGFACVLIASAIIFINAEILHIGPEKGFALLGWISLCVTITILALLYHHVTRYLGMLLSRIHFRMTVRGQEDLQQGTPKIFVCDRSHWHDTLILLGSQTNRIRFFTDLFTHKPTGLGRLYRMLKPVNLPTTDCLESYPQHLDKIQRNLDRGLSVCLLHDHKDTDRLITSLQNNLGDSGYSLIRVVIDKQKRAFHYNWNDSLFTPIIRRFLQWRIRAFVQFSPV